MFKPAFLLVACIVFNTLHLLAQTNNNYNLDFEQIDSVTHLPKSWGCGNIKNSNVPHDSSISAYKADSEEKQHGKYSLLIDWTNEQEEWTAINYVIKQNFKGKKIKLTGYIKTENVTGGYAGLWMRIDAEDSYTPLAFDNMNDRGVTGTTEWKQYSIELDYDADKAAQIVVGGLIVGKGKMWIDNLKVTIDDKDISEAPLQLAVSYKAAVDSEYYHSSGVQSIKLNDDKIKALTNLGMLWGFIKYYHPAVAKGEYNMDAALFRVLPKVLAANTIADANTVMEQWTDQFGVPDICKKCKEITKTDDIKLMPDYGYLFDEGNFPKPFREKLQFIKHNHNNSEKSYYIEEVKMVGNPVFAHEQIYYNSQNPDAGIRLLALYRYWNMVQYFFPDRHLIGEDWNKVLPEFIPDFCNAKDSVEYTLTCLRLIARIHDTHANVWGGGDALNKMMAKLMFPPFKATFVEDTLVVTGYYKDTLGIKDIVRVGDVIENIDGISVKELIKKYLPLTPASNYPTQLRDLPSPRGFLLRGEDSIIHIQVDRDGKKMEISTPRVPLATIYKRGMFRDNSKTAYTVIEGNIGYIYPAMLKETDIDSIKLLLKRAAI